MYKQIYHKVHKSFVDKKSSKTIQSLSLTTILKGYHASAWENRMHHREENVRRYPSVANWEPKTNQTTSGISIDAHDRFTIS